jgi:Sugar (and other) transporter
MRRTQVGISIVWPIILGSGILFMPESPRWYLKHDRPEQARRSLERIAGLQPGERNAVVDHDYAEMEISIEHERELGIATWIECFKRHERTLYRTIRGMSLQSLQPLTGANYCQDFFHAKVVVPTGVLKDPAVGYCVPISPCDIDDEARNGLTEQQCCWTTAEALE